jgi:TonB-dependent receptor
MNIEMDMDATSLAEIVVTTQALGQAGAINQMVNSSSIINVVSKDKIRELPDQNAAETVGRISGIYVQRDAGEGQKVVVRGLAPRFNNITVNGVRIPSTDPNDRSVDLSMISPDMLSGIEVFKAARPDMDGDAVGGSVNFLIKKAEEGFEGSANVQYGYNRQARELGQYKGTFNVSNRFLDNKLGVIATGNFQRANRSSDQRRASYISKGQDVFRQSLIDVEELNLVDIEEVRKRYGGSLTIDYKFNPNHSIVFSNLYSHTDRDEVRRRRRYRGGSTNNQEHDIRDRINEINLFSTSLQGQHTFSRAELTWQGSFSQTIQDTPNSFETTFREGSAFNLGNVSLIGQSADSLISLAKNDVGATFLQQLTKESDATNDVNTTFQADLKLPYVLTEKVAGFIKLGGKFRGNERTREKERIIGNQFATTGELADFFTDYPTIYSQSTAGGIAISNFLSGLEATDFLEGKYYLGPGAGNVNGPGLNRQMTSDFTRRLNQAGYLPKDYFGDVDDYTASEKIYAAYAMTELNVGKKLIFVGGVRLEHTETSYKGKFMRFGLNNREDDITQVQSALADSTGGRSYTMLLPMIQAKYKVNPWFDVRVAVTQTLSRPNFTNLIPYRRINSNQRTIEQANPQILQTAATNYDLFLTFYHCCPTK